jgi:serine/threonine protein kinase
VNISALRTGTKINGRYVVKGRIGVGWEGVTYQVKDRLDGRLKAVKFITNVKRRKAILNQARVLVRLHHPNIINYYNVDRVEIAGESHYFLLVEYLQGPRLSQVIRRHFRRSDHAPLFYGLRIFYQICRGMAYVHDQRILHDDLHTDNIILTGDLEAPTPKLFDFWGSRGGNSADRRAFDLRSAGQVLFETMTGHEDYDPAELEWLPRGVARIIRRAHARVHNYRTFHEILDDLEELRAWD